MTNSKEPNKLSWELPPGLKRYYSNFLTWLKFLMSQITVWNLYDLRSFQLPQTRKLY